MPLVRALVIVFPRQTAAPLVHGNRAESIIGPRPILVIETRAFRVVLSCSGNGALIAICFAEGFRHRDHAA